VDQQYLEEKEKEQSLKEAIVQSRPFFQLLKPKLGQRQWWPSPKRTRTLTTTENCCGLIKTDTVIRVIRSTQEVSTMSEKRRSYEEQRFPEDP
jgi:hypothetical protein